MIPLSNREYWLIEQSELSKDRIALLSYNGKLTFNDLEQRSKQIAAFISNNGVKENDHVAIFSDHQEDFVAVLNALWLIGAIAVPLNNRASSSELYRMIDGAECKYLINLCDQFKLVIRHIKIVNINKMPEDQRFSNLSIKQYDPCRICTLLFTSGSTGESKCVELSFNNLFESAKSVDTFINHTFDDLWLASLPFYHVGGLSIITRSIISGCRLNIPKSLKRNYLNEAIQRFNPSLVSFVHTMMHNVLIDFKKPWDNLRLIFIGGGPIPQELIDESLKNLWPITVVYGATETASMISISDTKNLISNGLSVGMPFEGVKISIEKEGFENFDAGRIAIQSKSVSTGYFNNIKSVQNAISDGKYLSNDLGKIDIIGNLHIFGRTDDIIISGGENISLGEIEKILLNDLNFGNCVPIAVKDKKWGQSYVILSDCKKNECKKKITEYLKKRIAKFKLPREIILIDEIPKDEMGKIKREELMKMLTLDLL